MTTRRWHQAVRVLVASALLSAVDAGAAHARQHEAPPVPRGWAGVMADGPLTEAGNPFGGEWRQIRRSGAGFARVAFYWPQLQPTPDRIDFGPTDAIVAAAARQRISVLPTVLTAPEWAAATLGGGMGATPRDPADYGRLMTALVGRYGPSGTFWREHRHLHRQPIRAWQVWNEPTLSSFWIDQPFVTGYVDLLRAAHSAIKAADPGAKVVLAGMPNESWPDLRAIYAAGGKGLFDVVALNIYTRRAAGVPTIVRRNRRVMRKAGDARTPVWITELAWSTGAGTAAGGLPWTTTSRGQARRLRQAITLLAHERKALHLQRVTWFTWLSKADRHTWTTYTGLRRVRHGKAVSTRAYTAFRRTVAALRRR